MQGVFISFEGGEGSGKSTQVKLLAHALEAAGKTTLCTREPGGTPGAEEIRALLVTGEPGRWLPATEALLFYAARHEHWQRVIAPAVNAGAIVLTDRFADSTRAYQAAGQSLSPAYIERLHALTLGNAEPDLTFLLDIAPEIGLARADARRGNETRFESEGLAFHTRIHEAYHKLAHAKPERFRLVDASQAVLEVHRAIIKIVNRDFGWSISPLPDATSV